jgi:hypothetical protein
MPAEQNKLMMMMTRKILFITTSTFFRAKSSEGLRQQFASKRLWHLSGRTPTFVEVYINSRANLQG